MDNFPCCRYTYNKNGFQRHLTLFNYPQMKKNKISKKFFIIIGKIFLIIILFSGNPTSTKALSICFGPFCMNHNTTDIYKEIENRYGFDQDIWRKAKRKVDAPRVEIFFDNTNPKPGEKVTAHAVPEFFKNDSQNLYYTWYLIHTKDGTPQTATNGINSGKIEASRIMSHGDYDPDLDGQTYPDPGKDPDKDGWPPVDINDYKKCLNNGDESDRTACSFAPFGGADGVGGLAEEFVEQYGNGDDYCRGVYGSPDTAKCDFYGDTSEESSYISSSYYYLLEYSSSNNQSDHWCNACWNDYHTPEALTSDDGTNGTCSDSRNKCCYDALVSPDPLTYSKSADYCSQCTAPDCDACYDAYKTCNFNNVSSCLTTEFNGCAQDWNSAHNNESTNEEIYTNVSRCYRHKFGEPTNNSTGFQTDDLSGLDFPVKCKHKWPNAPGYTSGSGKFPNGEEKYWKTDPNDPDTDGDGFFDEADVIGFGQESFTWTYQAGDRVGVVAEGTSMLPTDEKNAYFKIMWGYPDICDSTKIDLMDDDGCDNNSNDPDKTDLGFGFWATKSPNEEENGEKLKLSLSFAPDNPVADPTSDNKDNILDDGAITDADQITVTSSLDNTELNPASLYYTWQISKSTDLSSDNWKEMKNINDNFSISTPTNGLGLASLAFAPKKKVLIEDNENIIYFRVTLTLSTASDIKHNRGRSSVVIPVNKKGIKIGLYKVDIRDGKAIIGEEVCNDGLYKTLCPAVQNQMLGAKVTGNKYNLSNSEFSWSLNGNQYNVPADSSKYFDGLDSRTIIFPITKPEQEIEEISVTATPKNELRPVTGGRLVTVVKPALFIKTADESVSWPMKFTVPDETRKFASRDIISSDMFEALINKQVSYRLDFVPDYLLEEDYLNILIDWKFNGASTNFNNVYEENPDLQRLDLEDNDRTIKFTTSELEGRYYTLGAEIIKYWSDEERKISYTAWGINPETLRGETGITIATVSALTEEESALASPKQILAAIGTHLPHYLMYNLRLALTLLVMFFVSAGFYGLSQRLRLSK